jgi:hypothetical protein
MIADAVVDANDQDEALMGFHGMLEENLAVPFSTKVLGVAVTVRSIVLTSNGIRATCVRGGHTQDIDLLDLPLPAPPPRGSEWIAAYRRWARSL